MKWFSKMTWRLVKVRVLMDWKELDDFAFSAACELVDEKLASALYFSRYADKESGTWVEFKLKPLVPDDQIRAYLIRNHEPECVDIQIEDFEGSDAHAGAFAMARLLRGQGDQQIADVLHWMLNMTGYSYTREIWLYAYSTGVIANNLTRMETGVKL